MMFDDPGGKLKQLDQELRKIEDDAGEISPEENGAETGDFDENDVLLAKEPQRPGLRTLVFLLVIGLLLAGAGWLLGWI